MADDAGLEVAVVSPDSVSRGKQDDEEDLRYGCGPWKPASLQWLNNIVGAVAFLSLANGMLNLANALLGVMLSTIEKRYDLSSTASSWIASAYEIGPIPILAIVSYYGTKINRPLACGLGMLSVTIGCVLSFIPQFTTSVYRPSGGGVRPEDSLCRTNGTGPNPCDDADGGVGESLAYYLPVFIVARLFMGMGSTPIITVGVTYMDDCSTKEKFATYSGIFIAWSIIGPAIAFIGGGFMLNVFVDFYAVSKDEIGISTTDSRWIGAWWLPYIIAAVLNLLNAIPFFGYPPDLPGAAELRRQKVSEAQAGERQQGGDKEGDQDASVAEFKSRFIGVFTNPTWICLTVFAICDNFIIMGYTAFGPKLVEVIFAMSATMAGTLFGLVLLPAGAGGTIIGGLLVEKLKLSCRQIIHIQAWLSAFVTVASALFLLTCDPIPFAGISAPYNASAAGGQSGFNLTDSCNAACSCEHAVYEPICSLADNVQYYSPCHAGCAALTNKSRNDNNEEYFNCSCIAPWRWGANGSLVPSLPGEPVAVWGTCSSDVCPFAILFLSAFFLAVFAIFICMTMNMTATLRCITRSQAPLAISAQVLFIKLLGTIPGPVVIGLTFDLACDLWTDDCGVKGACLSYDIDQLARSQFYTCIVIKCVSLVAAVVAVCVYKPSQAAASVSPSDNASAANGVTAIHPSPLHNESNEGGGNGGLATLSTRHLSEQKLLPDVDLETEDNSAETCHL